MVLTEEDLIEEDEVKFSVQFDGLDQLFQHKLILDEEDADAAEAEEAAREELIRALRTGDVDVQWKTSTKTREDQEYTLSLQTSCERCDQTYGPQYRLQEVDTESDVIEDDVDFETEDSRYALVCDDCREVMLGLGTDGCSYCTNETATHRDGNMNPMCSTCASTHSGGAARIQ